MRGAATRADQTRRVGVPDRGPDAAHRRAREACEARCRSVSATSADAPAWRLVSAPFRTTSSNARGNNGNSRGSFEIARVQIRVAEWLDYLVIPKRGGLARTV